MVDAQKFWKSNPCNHPPLSDEMIAEAEAILGVTLPSELVALLKVQNGGYTRGFAFPMQQRTTWAQAHVALPDMNGIVTDPDHKTYQNIVDTPYMTVEWGLPSRQVLLSGDGHYFITLDYRNGHHPSVAWIDVECGEDIQIAPKFADFLRCLVPEAAFDAS